MTEAEIKGLGNKVFALSPEDRQELLDYLKGLGLILQEVESRACCILKWKWNQI